MDIFNLPPQTVVNRVIPKNRFDRYATPSQRRQFSEKIVRIKWSNKLATLTTNLPSYSIDEIQVFHIELKIQDKIPQILKVIEKAIPYRIIFVIEYHDQYFISASEKHPHPVNADVAVVDWTFSSEWDCIADSKYNINLRSNIDTVFKDFCLQLCDAPNLSEMSMSEIIEIQRQESSLKLEVMQLEKKVKAAQSFKKKVEYNMQLKKKEEELISFRAEHLC